MKQSKKTKILAALLRGESLTVAGVMSKFKTHKLSTRISELQDELSLPIIKEMKRSKNSSFMVYKLGKLSADKRKALNYFVKLKS